MTHPLKVMSFADIFAKVTYDEIDSVVSHSSSVDTGFESALDTVTDNSDAESALSAVSESEEGVFQIFKGAITCSYRFCNQIFKLVVSRFDRV